MRTLAITTFAFLGATLTPLLSSQATNTHQTGTASTSRASTSRASSSRPSQSNAGTKNQTPAKNAETPKTASRRKVDLNTASQGELESLPGVGAATAKKIIAGRPYSSVADLSKAGVPAKTVSSLNGMVTVGAPASTPNKASLSATANSAKQAGSSPATAQAGGPGMVWVNPDTKVFHRYGSRWYGKTKTGQYMTEADAVKAGYRESKQSGSSKQ